MTTPTRRRPALVLGLAIAGACALFFVASTLSGDTGGRKDIDLGAWVGTDDAWSRQMMPGARTATDELCGARLPCNQAVTSETLSMYRFATEKDAAAAARGFGRDAYLSHWIVVRFEPGGLTAAQRLQFGQDLECVDVGIADDGREC